MRVANKISVHETEDQGPWRFCRVLRGGSWNNNTEMNLRSSNRNNDTPTNRNDNNGFRCVLEVAGVGGKASCLARARWRVGIGSARSERGWEDETPNPRVLTPEPASRAPGKRRGGAGWPYR